LSSELVRSLQAILFAAANPMSSEELGKVLEISVERVAELLTELGLKMLNDEYCGIQLDESAGGYRLVTKPETGVYIEKVTQIIKPGSLSIAALETLAIIAYKQPITRAEIEAIRGVRVESPLNTLIERELIAEVGRKDAPGRPVLYATTDQFLSLFGLNSVQDLPPLEQYQE
jgi:segregation and condensation protein B